MQVSYNKLWKILIDRGMSTAELRKKADFAPNTLTKLKQNQPVALTLLAKICAVLNTDIGHIMSFVPEEIKEEKVVSKNSLDYFNISKALSMEFSSVYHVNTNTDEYVKYESDPGKELKIASSGSGFFKKFNDYIERNSYPKDREHTLMFFKKENLLKSLQLSNVLTLTYRMKRDDSFYYSRAKVILTPVDGVDYIVISVGDVDSSVRREIEQTNALNTAIKMASKDPLTSVGNTNAYKEAEKEYDNKLSNGEISNFSIVFCDVNDLKITNDTLGHAAGDMLIKYVSSTICSTFKHSPVFRVGGDEFVVFLSGEDFDNREILFRDLRNLNRKQAMAGKNVFACGMATFNPETDFAVSSVIERADSMMYYNKRELKAIQNESNKKRIWR